MSVKRGDLVRTTGTRWNIPIGSVCLAISATYKPPNTQSDYFVVDILVKGERRVIDIYSVEKVQ